MNLILIEKKKTNIKQNAYWVVEYGFEGDVFVEWVIKEFKEKYPKHYRYYKTFKSACQENGLEAAKETDEKFIKRKECQDFFYKEFKRKKMPK